MDKTSKLIVEFLKKQPEQAYYWGSEPVQDILPDEEFRRCVDFMVDSGYIDRVKWFGGSGGFRLNHKYVHEKEFKIISIKNFFRNNWISLLAILISLVSIFASPFFNAFFTNLYKL